MGFPKCGQPIFYLQNWNIRKFVQIPVRSKSTKLFKCFNISVIFKGTKKVDYILESSLDSFRYTQCHLWIIGNQRRYLCRLSFPMFIGTLYTMYSCRICIMINHKFTRLNALQFAQRGAHIGLPHTDFLHPPKFSVLCTLHPCIIYRETLMTWPESWMFKSLMNILVISSL